MELWQPIFGGIISLVVTGLVAGVVYIRTLKKQVHELEKKCESLASKDALKALELNMKDLERTDALQQQALDQLPNLLPLIKRALDVIKRDKQ